MERVPFVIGNWKMHKSAAEAVAFVEAFAAKIPALSILAGLAVPFTHIEGASIAAKKTPLRIGAQNMHDASEGAFTGEIAASMLLEAGASFVLLGHSERRTLFHETDALINRKVIRALQDGLQPILCVGETAADRKGGLTEGVLKGQVSMALEGVPEAESKNLVIAYEPTWAIGTGKTPEVAQVQEALLAIRSSLEEILGKKRAAPILLLYGGSVSEHNAASFLAKKEVDGFLVGGASLALPSFLHIIQQVEVNR